jgi:hypothetical protein
MLDAAGEAKAELIALTWREKSGAAFSGEPKVRQLLESQTISGSAYYVVSLGESKTSAVRELLAMMDGTIVTPDVKIAK